MPPAQGGIQEKSTEHLRGKNVSAIHFNRAVMRTFAAGGAGFSEAIACVPRTAA
jgi:hypothetical protein